MFDIKVVLTEMLVGIMVVASFSEALLFQDLWTKIFGFGVFAMFCIMGYLLARYTYREVNAKETLEQKVQERTKELEASKKLAEERATELEKWYKLTIGRELRMAELKDKIKEMEEKK
jgi:C4-dicarboxylate-specific signal transduction histidine kinase